MMVINVASYDERFIVLDLLNEAAGWLRQNKDTNQWEKGFRLSRILPRLERGETYLAMDKEKYVATIVVSHVGNIDADLWSPAELAQPAVYLAGLAVSRSHAGRGLGAMLTRWALDQAAQRGFQWGRLDAWRTNKGLRRYYLRNGWSYIRTVEHPTRTSTALFQRPAVVDHDARAAFHFDRLSLGSHNFSVGDRVRFDVGGTSHCGTVKAAQWTDPSERSPHDLTSMPYPTYEICTESGTNHFRTQSQIQTCTSTSP